MTQTLGPKESIVGNKLNETRAKKRSRIIHWILIGVLVAEGLLLFVNWIGWIGAGSTKGWAVLATIGAAAILPAIILVGIAVSGRFRSRFRYSLTTLAGLVLATAIPNAWLSFEMHQSRLQEQTVQAVLEVGGAVRYQRPNESGPKAITSIVGDEFFSTVESVQAEADKELDGPFGGKPLDVRSEKKRSVSGNELLRITKDLTDVKILDLSGTDVDDEALASLSELQQLENLRLDGTQITDAGLMEIAKITTIRRISVKDTNVSDEGLAHLAKLGGLEGLNLKGTDISDNGLRYVSGLLDLQFLNLQGTQITDAGMSHIGGLTKLVSLNLRGTAVTGAGIQFVGNNKDLTRLLLDATGIDDDGLAHFKGLAKLQSLLLDDTLVTDTGLHHLEGLTSLRTLTLPTDQVSDEAVKRLQEALPNCDCGVEE